MDIDLLVLDAKLFISLACLFCTYFICNWKGVFRIRLFRFGIASFAFLFALRISLFILIFIIFDIPPTSDVEVYYHQATATISGQVPYKDFNSGYSLFFPYICSLPLFMWDSPKAIVLLSIFIEWLSFIVWFSIAKELFDDFVIRISSLLYIFNPLPLFNIGISGQNQIWISFLCGLSFYALLKGKELISFLIYIVTLMSTKLLALFYLPSLFFMAKKRFIWLLILLFSICSLYIYFKSVGIDLLNPLKNEFHNRSSGTVSFLLTLFPFVLSHYFSIIIVLLLLLIIVKIFWRAFLLGSKNAPIYVLLGILFIFMIFSFKAYTNYLVICFFPLCILVSTSLKNNFRKEEIILFGLFSLVATMEPSLWYRWLRESDFTILWQRSSAFEFKKIVAFLAFDIMLIFFYVYYLIKVLKIGLLAQAK